MTLLRAAARRGRYRVYTEEEFFAADGPLAAAIVPGAEGVARGRGRPVGVSASGGRAIAAWRLAGFASLSFAVAAVAGIASVQLRVRAGGGRRLSRPGVLGARLAGRTARTSTVASSGVTVRHAVLLALTGTRRPDPRAVAARGVGAPAPARAHPPAAPARSAAVSPQAALAAGAATTTRTAATDGAAAPAVTNGGASIPSAATQTSEAATPSGGASTASATPAPAAMTATAASAGARHEFGFER
jgi:hypothetical protein